MQTDDILIKDTHACKTQNTLSNQGIKRGKVKVERFTFSIHTRGVTKSKIDSTATFNLRQIANGFPVMKITGGFMLLTIIDTYLHASLLTQILVIPFICAVVWAVKKIRV